VTRIAVHNRDVKSGLLLSIPKTAGISRNELCELLQQAVLPSLYRQHPHDLSLGSGPDGATLRPAGKLGDG
jgi:hypothetical protein